MQTTTTTTTTTTSGSRDAEIQQLAYKLWELAGCPAGYDLTFWLHAEQQVMARQREQDSQRQAAARQADVAEFKPARTRQKAAGSAKTPAAAPSREARKSLPFIRSSRAG